MPQPPTAHTAQRAIEVAYLVPERFWSSTISSMAEVFQGMQLSAGLFQNSAWRGFGETFLRCTPEPVSGFSGLRFDTQYFADVGERQFDVVVLPSVWGLSMDNLERTRPALQWLKQQHTGGATVVGLVTGVFHLAEAGLLDGREATIHWASENIFRQRYPKVRVSPRLQMVEADRIITTATTPATFDATLLLIQRFLGDRSAEFASHYFTIRDKDAPLPVFLEPSCNDTLVDAARDYMRLHLTDALTLPLLAHQLSVTPRTLSRRFLAATGMTPIHYLLRHRLNNARRLLGATDLQIQQVAEQSGFASATVFCRNFSKAFGQSPRAYRRSLPSAK